jgi:glyoxylase-like metal-dependent hydrolase (beta-lactamase superfamily II)
VKELLPGKPIRYAAITHHHDDHAGGTRDYVAEGATIVTTPGNRRYVERMAAARPTIRPDALARRPQPLRVETIAGKRRVLSGGGRTVELIDIGPSPHAEEMLVAWLPNERVLFQGDLLNLPTNALGTPMVANATTRHFADWLRRSGLQPRVLAGVHMEPGTTAQLEQVVAGSWTGR